MRAAFAPGRTSPGPMRGSPRCGASMGSPQPARLTPALRPGEPMDWCRSGPRPSGSASRRRRSASGPIIWAHRGVVSCDQRCAGSKLWVRLTDADIARLDGSEMPPRLTGIAEVIKQDQITRAEVWDRVRAGRYTAYRVRHGLEGWQRGLRPAISGASGGTPPDCPQLQKEPHYE